jgi:predicted nucleic acid-binding Zn ribbon protein
MKFAFNKYQKLVSKIEKGELKCSDYCRNIFIVNRKFENNI